MSAFNLFFIITIFIPLIKPWPSANDVDASIAKLINGYGSITQSPPSGGGGFILPQISDTYRQNNPPTSNQQQPPLKNQSPTPTLNLVNGTVTGKAVIVDNLETVPAINTSECHVFLGIPYAAPPIDQLRFKAPKPALKFPSVLEAIKYKASCIQDAKTLPKSWSINEDCLHLNIFKPAVNFPVPIVIWIHGGAFLTGSATTLNPSTACRQVVVNTLIVITINYRLGPFGFPAHDNLSTTDTNLGLRDIAQAVRWVQENTVALGGEKNQTVLVGHGGGAALVSHLLDSGLIDLTSIKGAILMSGSGLAPWAITKHSWQSTSHLMQELNCNSFECMKKLDANKILEKAPRLWSPYVDNTTILANDAKKIDSKRFDQKNFPLIIGFTMQEGTALAVQKLAPVTGQPLREKITRSLIEFTGESKEFVERRYLYDRATPIDFFDNIFDFIDALSEAYSDLLFKLPSVKEATARTQQQSSNVYIYAIRNDLLLPGKALPNYKASYHGSDLEMFWFPYTIKSRANLLGAFLQVILHQDENLPWRPWSPRSPVILQVTPYGGQFITFRPRDFSATYQNQSYFNHTTPKYGNAAVAWTVNPNRKFTLINSNATPKSILFNAKKIGTATPTFSTSTETTTPPNVNVTSTLASIKNFTNPNSTGDSNFSSPFPNLTLPTSTKSSARTNTTSETNTPASTGQQDSLVWVLLGLAVLFLFLFLITVGGCAAWNRQSYHPHPNRRSRHQGAKVRSGQRIPPPVAPLESSSNSHPPLHQPRTTHKESSDMGKSAGPRRSNNQQSNIITSAHSRRPRQPPPNLPPLLTKDIKRN